MKRTLVVLATVLLLTFFPHSQFAQQAKKARNAATKSPGANPTVDQILDKYVQAIGGVAAHRKLTSRITKGTFVMPDAQNLTSTFEGYEKAPNKSLAVINLPGVGITREGYNGVIGWSQEPEEEIRVMTGPELVSAKIDSDFYKCIRLREVFPKLTLKGTERVGDKLAYKLVGVSKEGHVETMYFDVESGLLLGTDTVEEIPGSKIVMRIRYEDYREVDGIKLPFAARHQSPELNMIFKISEIKHNSLIEDAMFEKPKS
jgi:zinc protease